MSAPSSQQWPRIPSAKSERRVPTLDFPSMEATGDDAWDALVETSRDGWVFSLAAWQRVILSVEEWELEDHSFGVRRGADLLAVVPLQYSPRTNRLVSSGFGLSGPVLSRDLGEKQAYRVLEAIFDRCGEIAEHQGADTLEVGRHAVTESALGESWSVNPFVKFGFEDTSTHTLLVDLSVDENTLWAGLSQSARQSIKRAREAGCLVERGDWDELLDDYYRVHTGTYARTGVEPHPRRYFEGIARRTGRSGHSLLWVARDQSGEAIAFHNDARLGSRRLYHTGCSTKDALRLGANYLLFWESMVEAKCAGSLWYECGEVFPGVTSGKLHGLTVFKSKFGGEVHRTFRGVRRISVDRKTPVAATETAVETSGGRRQAVWNWLVASRALMTEVLGHRATAVIAGIVRPCVTMLERIWTSMRSMAAHLVNATQPRVRFMRPRWGFKEVCVGYFGRPGDDQKEIDSVEVQLRETLGIPPDAAVILTGSGRTAIRLGLSVLRDQSPERDKVILPSYGCRGLIEPIHDLGLRPLFVDIDESLNPVEQQMIDLLAKDVLACLFVHLGGKTGGTSALKSAAEGLGVTVIDDDCQNLGGRQDVGQSHLAVFSFGIGKNAMATAGGCLVGPRFANECRLLGTHLSKEPETHARARFRYFYKRYFLPQFMKPRIIAGHSDVAKYLTQYEDVAMSALDARLLSRQLARLPEILEKRKRNAFEISRHLKKLQSICSIPDSSQHIFTKYSLTFKDRNTAGEFVGYMAGRGIELEQMYTPLHLREVGEGAAHADLSRTTTIHENIYNFPVRPNLSRRQIRHIGAAIDGFLGRNGHGSR